MFTKSTVITGMRGEIGFRNPNDPNIQDLDSGLTSSTSGVYMDDFHPLCNTDNLEAIAPDFDGMNYDTFIVTATYALGDKVSANDFAWMSKVAANVGNTPAVGTYWKTSFSGWLLDKYDGTVGKVLFDLENNKKVSDTTKTYLESVHLFDGTRRFSDTVVKSSRFVGFELELKPYNNIKATIDRIGLMFTSAQTDLTLYLFHSSSETAIATATVSTTTANKFEWKDPSWNLSYVDYTNNIESEGKWFIGYFEADISGNAINKIYDWDSGPCDSCGGHDRTYYNLWSKYVRVKSIEVANGDLNGTNLFDVEEVTYSFTETWGLNLAMSVKTDFTEMALNNKSLFVNPIGLRFNMDMIRQMTFAADSRFGSRASNVESKALTALSGEGGIEGIEAEYRKSIEALAEDFADISPVLPERKRGFKYGAI